jgi:uncharacterized protein
MKRIRCPIHNHISLDDQFLRIVDDPLFQRLRGIKQLGMAYLVYPGAQHTRFEHSLGVFHLATSVTSLLCLPKEDARLIHLSGLLHDIGHGPFSHIMESVGDRSHERQGANLITDSTIADLIMDMGIDPKTIAGTLQGTTQFSPLISSEIDLDRMDYLLRDAHYTGVSSALDAGRLSAVMELENDTLVFREAGLGAVEALLLARFMMYPYVYYHHTARSAERMLGRAIHILHRDGGATMDDLWTMDDISLVAFLRSSPGLPGSIMQDIDRRNLHKRGWEQPLGALLPEGGLAMRYSPLPSIRKALTPRRIRGFEAEIAETLDIHPDEVILDCPLPPVIGTGDIIIKRLDGTLTPARLLSRMIDVMEHAQLDHWRFRLFVPGAHREKARSLLTEAVTSLFVWNEPSTGRVQKNQRLDLIE